MSKSKEQQFKESRLRTRTNSIEDYDRGKRLLGYNSDRAAIAFSSAYMGFLSGAQSGDSVSAGYLGLMYQAGHGVDTSSLEYNFTRAVIWYARAINLCKRRGDAAAMQEKAEYEAKLNEMLQGQTLEEYGVPEEAIDDYLALTQDILISTSDLPTVFDEDELAVMAQFLAPGALSGVGASPAPHAAAAAVTAPAAPTPTVAPVAHHDAAPHLVPQPLDHGHTLGLAGADHGGDCG